MAEPLLHLGDIGFVVERVSSSRRPQGVNAEAIDLGVDARRPAIFADNVVIDGIRIERAVEFLGAIVGNWTEHWRGGIAAMARKRQIFLDQLLCCCMHGNEADLAALAVHAEMHHALTAVQITQAQTAELIAAEAVLEQGGQNGAIAHALERVLGRRIEQLTRLGIAERRG